MSKVLNALTFTQNTRMIMLGLDAAGKTTILYKLKLGDLVTTIPTIGFNVEHVTYKNLDMHIWDVGGQDKIRPHFDHTDAVMWIIDSNDNERLDEAREELHKVLADDCLRNAAVIVYANKQDLPRALPTDHIAEKLGLRALRGREWYIQPCSAKSGEGLFEGLEWLQKTLRDAQRARSHRGGF